MECGECGGRFECELKRWSLAQTPPLATGTCRAGFEIEPTGSIASLTHQPPRVAYALDVAFGPLGSVLNN